MKAMAWRLCDGAPQTVSPEAAVEPCEGLSWVHLEGSDQSIPDWLRDTAKLPSIVIGALTATETRPRCEPMEEGAIVNLRGLAANPEEAADSLASVRMYVTRGRVVSVSRVTLSALPAVQAKMEEGKLNDPGDLVTAIAVAITKLLDPDVAALGDSLDACEIELDARDSWRFRRAVSAARRTAIDYRRFVQPQRDALERLAGLEVGWLDASDRQHIAEAGDRFARMTEELESIRERAALMHDQLTDMRAELLDTRSLLVAVVALIFLPLTFVTGLLGMNVAGIPYADEPWAFSAVVGICVLMAAGLGGYFIRAHWFRR
ncbi:zinc transporter [Sphingomonas jejuensis]|uniref:Zinc transporter n=1 Tax=Sphingomonas jejuensis TaxID=904715 RepID=A0ABX0XNM6_9SPHN|nr:zinc transporter ZntB [Sphingomonas jejuensis]NJC34979.1 zinc transporter [Sphingomonas jejuensis]